MLKSEMEIEEVNLSWRYIPKNLSKHEIAQIFRQNRGFVTDHLEVTKQQLRVYEKFENSDYVIEKYRE